MSYSKLYILRLREQVKAWRLAQARAGKAGDKARQSELSSAIREAQALIAKLSA